MIAAESPFLLQTHCSQGAGYGPLGRGERRTRQKQLDMPRKTPSENSGANGASTCIIVVGRVRT
jgi:hypothetical protein